MIQTASRPPCGIAQAGNREAYSMMAHSPKSHLDPDVEILSPELAPILALHRHQDGYIAFAVARDDGEDKDFRQLVSIRADELARYFPQFREQFLKDSYVSINA